MRSPGAAQTQDDRHLSVWPGEGIPEPGTGPRIWPFNLCGALHLAGPVQSQLSGPPSPVEVPMEDQLGQHGPHGKQMGGEPPNEAGMSQSGCQVGGTLKIPFMGTRYANEVLGFF